MEEKDFLFDGVTVRYRDCLPAVRPRRGEPPVIVLMHGWGCRASTLASVEAVCLEAGWRVINVDFPGFGSSSEPSEPWGVERYADCMEALLYEELALERPALLGHSFGGRVAIVLGSRRPEGYDKIILVDAAGVKPKRPLSYYIKVYSFKAKRHAAELLLGHDRAQALVEKMRSRSGSQDYAGSSPMMRRILSRVVNEDLCHLMPLMRAHTLLIWGEDDTATPLSDARTMARLIHNAGLVTFPRCGHYSFLDNPRQFAAVLRSFLAS